MKATWKVAGVEKAFKRLTIDENVSSIGTWSAVRDEVEDLAPFSPITVEREGITIFGGRIERPDIDFSRAGSEIRPGGFDYTIKLTDYLTPQKPIANKTTDEALEILLENTPFTRNIIDEFGYITDPTVYDTTCEFLEFAFYDTCIEFLHTTEIITEVDLAGNTLPASPALRCCFWTDTGVNRRMYIFYKSGGNLKYRFSNDCGATWSAEANPIGGPIAVPTANWSVVWYNSKVYLFLEDGVGGNTDFWRGTIDDDDGEVHLGLIAGNIFANGIRAGPIFDNEGHIWVIEDTVGNGDVWENINDGAPLSWSNEFTAQRVAKLLLPRAADAGDIWIIEFDAGDLELWYWDESLGAPEIEDSTIVNEPDFVAIGGAQNADYTVHIAWKDNTNNIFYDWKTEAGAWNGVQTFGIGGSTDNCFQISADRGVSAYIFAISAAGFQSMKIKSGVATAWNSIAGVAPGAPFFTQSPQTGLWDGELAVFGITLDTDDDLWYALLDPFGIRIDRGLATGYFLTNTITAGGFFVRWGYCAADGIEVPTTDWSVRLAADDSLLGTGGQKVTFDMDIASGNTAEEDIKIRADMTDSVTDPYVDEISFSEKIDSVTMELDFEDVYTGMLKWVALSGAEFWLDSSDELQVAYTRGSDKSNLVFLKNSKTSDYPAIEPNIKVISRNPDWAPFANAIKVIGAEGPPRVEAEVTDQPSIDEHGEHWYCHRDPDIQTTQMAETVGAIQLARRNTVIDRIRAVILDEYDPTDIEIGDNVWVVAEFGDDVATKLNASMRVVSLNRSWGPDGEQVSLELINLISASEYWAHLVTIADLTRWVTA